MCRWSSCRRVHHAILWALTRTFVLKSCKWPTVGSTWYLTRTTAVLLLTFLSGRSVFRRKYLTPVWSIVHQRRNRSNMSQKHWNLILLRQFPNSLPELTRNLLRSSYKPLGWAKVYLNKDGQTDILTAVCTIIFNELCPPFKTNASVQRTC